MAIPSSSIIDFATPIHEREKPGIQAEVRDRLEWIWGLAHGHLDEHLREFTDPQNLLTDETILIFPPNDIIQALSFRRGKTGLCRTPIEQSYNGCRSFEYLAVAIDPADTSPPRILSLEVPPHLVLITTSGKIMKAWACLSRQAWNSNRISVVERGKGAAHNVRPALELEQLNEINHIYRMWSWIEPVPLSFLSGDSETTMVEPEEQHRDGKQKSTHGNSDSKASSSGSRREPKRRLLPSELQRPPLIRLFPSADSDDDENDAISNDSHISGVDGDPEEFVKASIARGDYEVDRKWLKGIRRWAAKASKADVDETLLNDRQIKEDSREQPRDATSLDLAKPDYLRRHKYRIPE
ncbi:hypothetical protein K438DRAFT_2016270 [Mycena galopus ATCC 62051]|nr:hypothetical protein K438DRAFT_2016270 [Mycena galopus ATCC 62051]